MDVRFDSSAQRGSPAMFFVLAFGLSWAVWVPAALASHGLIGLRLPPALTALLGAWGPTLAALLLTLHFGGRAGLRQLFGRLLIWRVGLRWYAFAIGWPVALALLTTGLALLLGYPAPDLADAPLFAAYPLPAGGASLVPVLAIVVLQQLLLGSAMGEEPGWRGYALPRLQARFGPLAASLVLGLLWGLWHLPLLLTRGDARAATPLLPYLLGIVAVSILFTWVALHTRGSLLLAVLLHGSIALTGLLLAAAPLSAVTGPLITLGVALVVVALGGLEMPSPGGAGERPVVGPRPV